MNHNAGHIQVTDLFLKTVLTALAKQRDEPLNATIKAALAAGIIALTKDTGGTMALPERPEFRICYDAQGNEHAEY